MSGPSNLPIARLATGDLETAIKIRYFCLKIINQVYGIAYHPEWHSDLDSLLLDEQLNWFSSENRGAFFFVRNDGDEIVAAGGLYDLMHKPSTATRLESRYRKGERVCQVVRVYLDADSRGSGLGTRLVTVIEQEARITGYQVSYLHADAGAMGTLRFWSSSGYREFERFSYASATGTDTSVDFDKLL